MNGDKELGKISEVGGGGGGGGYIAKGERNDGRMEVKRERIYKKGEK